MKRIYARKLTELEKELLRLMMPKMKEGKRYKKECDTNGSTKRYEIKK